MGLHLAKNTKEVVFLVATSNINQLKSNCYIFKDVRMNIHAAINIGFNTRRALNWICPKGLKGMKKEKDNFHPPVKPLLCVSSIYEALF